MSAYIIKRIVSAVVTLFLVATLTFFLMYLVPGGPFLSEKAPSPQTLKALEEKYGLDQPIGVQYVNYMKRLLHGDLGTSLKMRGQEVNDIIKTRFPVSARLGLMAVALAILVGIPMGAVAALNRGKWFDRLIMFVSTLGIAVPGFVVATVLMYLFGVELHVLLHLALLRRCIIYSLWFPLPFIPLHIFQG